MKLYLVRHGETAWNKLKKVQGHSDISLNAYGRYLAEETANGLRDISFAAAYTSPLSRAKETAQLILAGRNIPLYEDIRIQEMGFGVAEGMCCRGENKEPGSDEFNKLFTDTKNYIVPEGGESIGQLEDRIQDFLHELYDRKEYEDKTLLISTHGAALTAMLNLIKGQKDIARFWENGVPANCSVTEVTVQNGRAEIIEEGRVYY